MNCQPSGLGGWRLTAANADYVRDDYVTQHQAS
jgi:hypothetical protein